MFDSLINPIEASLTHNLIQARLSQTTSASVGLYEWATPGARACQSLYEIAVGHLGVKNHLRLLFGVCESVYKDKASLRDLRDSMQMLVQLIGMPLPSGLDPLRLEPAAAEPQLELMLSSNMFRHQSQIRPLDLLTVKICGYRSAQGLVLARLGLKLTLQRKDREVELCWDDRQYAATLRRCGFPLTSYSYTYDAPATQRLVVPVRPHLRSPGGGLF